VRVECESCKELVAARFAIDGDAVRATCPVCDHVMTASGPPAVAPDPAAQCPKCGAARAADAAACATCGLSVARMAAYTEARDAEVPAEVRDAWTQATERWAEPASHDELFRRVAAHGCYAWAAGRYRTRKDAVAVRQLDRLRRAAEATLFASATVRPDATARPYRAATAVLLALIIAIAVGLVYAMVVRDRPLSPATPARPAQPLTPGHPVGPSSIR
jgi:hypothetical protein